MGKRRIRSISPLFKGQAVRFVGLTKAQECKLGVLNGDWGTVTHDWTPPPDGVGGFGSWAIDVRPEGDTHWAIAKAHRLRLESMSALEQLASQSE